MKATRKAAGDAWEWIWAPYDEVTYAAVLQHISPHDVVLEIGAGDFRLARRLAVHAKAVYAIECQQLLLENFANYLPANCQVLAGDARHIHFPPDVSTAVLLMRHCTHLKRYWGKLLATNCRKLITNARWGMGVEAIDLRRTRQPFQTIYLGWFACSCGQTGFVPGDAENITDQVVDNIWEVSTCPACSGGLC